MRETLWLLFQVVCWWTWAAWGGALAWWAFREFCCVREEEE